LPTTSALTAALPRLRKPPCISSSMKTPVQVRDGVSNDLSSGQLVRFELW
jgi:hypothetical protein